MKNHLKLLEYSEFTLIFFIFVMPPLLSSPNNVQIQATRPLLQLCTYTTLLLFFYIRTPKPMHIQSILYMVKACFFAVVVLFGGMFSLSTIASSFGITDDSVQALFDASLTKPIDLLTWIHIFISTAVLASFEEVLFRYFLPIRGKQFLKLITKNQCTAGILAELLALGCFALAHRYLGLFAVLNALFAGAVLRYCVKKTGTILSTCVVHTLYNFLIFAVY